MFSKQTNLLVSATALLLFVKVVDAGDYYCKLESCSNPKRHVLCLFPLPSLSDRCSYLVRSGMVKSEKQIILRLHVEIRQKHAARMKSKRNINYPEMYWDHDLEEFAQRWADQCTTENDECRSIDEYGYVVKQNIGYYVIKHHVPHLKRKVAFDLGKVVEDWARTPVNPANPAVKKYHAIDRLGCGMTMKSDCDWKVSYPSGSAFCLNYYHVFVVCNYAIKKMRLQV